MIKHTAKEKTSLLHVTQLFRWNPIKTPLIPSHVKKLAQNLQLEWRNTVHVNIASARSTNRTTRISVILAGQSLFGRDQFFTYTVCIADWLFGAVFILLPFSPALLFSCYFLSSFVLFRGSQGKVPPAPVGELCRDTACDVKGQSRHNWTAEAPAGGHSVDPKDCKKGTGGSLPASCWSSLSGV